MRDYVFDGGTAVVTGAASGIGEALAHALAARGSNLVLLDRDAERLATVAKTVGSTVDVSTHVVDLASAQETAEVAERVLAENPRLTLLVNNAGVALGGRFDQVTLEEFGWVIDINFRAPVQLTHALLPALKASPGSHIATVSSVFGLIAPAGQSAYSASKFAVRGFTEAIRHELAGQVGVTSVHPGGIRTRIAQSARVGSGVPGGMDTRQWERVLRMDPAKAAAIIVDAIEHRKPRVLIGWSAKIPDLLVRLLPGAHSRILGRLG
ncbi:SDR family NAD(P)-dependent oxidoreductase [Amycolatopsis thermophila]|uniref:Short-subunit dehydrogenase n=1 Tax=Amycolatopsis thermophila TaxID=206084 RepID=A0ABU0ELR2_9PSEU|nr:SDR family NAD(P)-dependent oxidoreductase [Amycolatopsis thermophila]MDQ0376119.1 short-subunit dehydrogenase [Amycolatopsis thermophila]